MHTSERLIAALEHAPLIPSPLFNYRVIAERWRGSPLSAVGSVKRGGRYNLPGMFPVLYTADSPVTAMLEAEALTVTADGRLRGVPRDPEIILTVECALSRVLDLTNLEILAELGTSREELVSVAPSRFILNARGEETPTQLLGAACVRTGRISALKVPSAQNQEGFCLDILLESIVPGERVAVKDNTGRLKGGSCRLKSSDTTHLQPSRAPFLRTMSFVGQPRFSCGHPTENDGIDSPYSHHSAVSLRLPTLEGSTLKKTFLARRFTPAASWLAGRMLASLLGLVFLLGHPATANAQTIHYASPPSAERGEIVYRGGCIACHGADGKGSPLAETVFKRPDTWPDFTDCAGTTPEPNGNWKAAIVHGGPSRGLSQIMPAFGDLLTDAQINDVMAYMRQFCQNKHNDPRGELNLPRALVTEKAFPENEVVTSTAASASGAPSWTTDIIDERTVLDARTQLETDIPINYADQEHNWEEGVGDITIGLKREMFASLRTGSILSLQGGILLPTGDAKRGFGAGTTQFEPFAAFDQLFRNNTFLQTQLGADLPFNTSVAPRSLFYRAALGKAFAADNLLGRLYSPMVEFLARRDFKPGAATDWDILPEMQITVSRRQHVRVGFGVREPFTDTTSRTPQVLFYILWDHADGKLWDGWR